MVRITKYLLDIDRSTFCFHDRRPVLGTGHKYCTDLENTIHGIIKNTNLTVRSTSLIVKAGKGFGSGGNSMNVKLLRVPLLSHCRFE